MSPLSNVRPRPGSCREGGRVRSTAGAEPEPEPTALVAIALDDAARRWLAGAQRSDGSFGLTAGPVENDAATGLAALALPPGAERERAGIWHVNEGGRFLGRSDPEQIAQIGEDPERSMTPFDMLPVFEHLRVGSDAATAPTPVSATRTPDATGDGGGRWSAWHRPEPSPPCSRSAC